MVAISLYRGNLHRVPDVPRRWLMPSPQISLKTFRVLINRRNRALSLLRSSPNPNPIPKFQEQTATKSDFTCIENNCSNGGEETSKDSEARGLDVRTLVEQVVNGSELKTSLPDNSVEAMHVNANLNTDTLTEVNPSELAIPISEKIDKVETTDDRKKREKEIGEKLQVLNSKKHTFVQVLKQILNAEEELKRRNNMQGTASRSSARLQVEATNDSTLVNKSPVPRAGSEANLGNDTEGVEANNVLNHNAHPRHGLRLSSTSPSSESPFRKGMFAQQSAVPHFSRATSSGSPSLPAQRAGHPGNPLTPIPTVSVSGTSFIASSPSPATSGGTSAFRDSRLSSPWS